MSLLGNVAVEGAMEELLLVLKNSEDVPADERLKLLQQAIENIHSAAKSGWY